MYGTNESFLGMRGATGLPAESHIFLQECAVLYCKCPISGRQILSISWESVFQNNVKTKFYYFKHSIIK
jgi:hypothetical protein